MKVFSEWDKVNGAIEKCLKVGYWSHSKDKTTLSEMFGNEVADIVEEIYNYAISYKVDWQIDTMKDVQMRLKESLKEKYENLNEEAIQILARCFSYNWK